MTTIGDLDVHPYADRFPMLSDDELDELAASIAANGLRQPIVVTVDGLILDGRNRARACESLGLDPETVVYEGDDLAEYVIDCNTTRRHLSTGQRAMASALVLADDGRRENGRWKRGSVDNGTGSDTAFAKALQWSGLVPDYAPELADQVTDGTLPLKTAFATADERRKSAEADELARKAAERREREEAKAKAERDAQIKTDLATADPRYLELIEDGTLTPAAAWAAHQADTEKERRAEAELDRGRRDTCTAIAESTYRLDGGKSYGDIFLRDFYPHEHRFLAEPLRLTRRRLDSCIEFLQTVKEGLPA